MDVTSAVDTLFSGVVPERIQELKQNWGQGAERVRLLDQNRFLLQQIYGTVQVSEVALRQIWLTGFAAQRAIDAYNVPLVLAAVLGQVLDPAEWRGSEMHAEKERAFYHVFDKITELGVVGNLDDFAWPDGVPYPESGLKITDPELKGTFDLVCMAAAYIFAHEVRHSIFEAKDNSPPDRMDEERQCDSWALALMLDQAGNYAIEKQWDPSLVRAKRILAIIIAKLTILTLTPRDTWDASSDHPPVRERLRAVLDAAVDPLPDWFWTTVTSMLLAFALRLGISIDRRPLPPNFRSLSYDICGLIRS
jgi:hypothetical protein